MPQQQINTVENHFTSGLKTEYTGLNFPENAATDTDNCVYTLVGEVIRRGGFDLENNYNYNNPVNNENKSISYYVWNNAGGDGNTKILVIQMGSLIYFFSISAATNTLPLSWQQQPSTVNLANFLAVGSVNDPSQKECQFSDGNGYLFIFHPDLDPIYCTYVPGSIVGNVINIQVRDFTGVPETGVSISTRPNTLSAEHQYNLTNQGWSSIPAWSATSADTIVIGTGSKVFNIASGLTITNGTIVQIFSKQFNGVFNAPPNGLIMTGTVTSYAGTVLTVNISSTYPPLVGTTLLGGSFPISIVPTSIGYISTWVGAIGNYPSNADVWWRFKNSSDVFDPATTVANVSVTTGPAPKGHYILSAFNIDRSLASGTPGITPATTIARPRTGTWFQGRVWYAGVDAAQPASGDLPHTTWSENLYFTQIVEDASQFGMCYQNNDPTSEDLFDLLPTDGGVIRLQGSGAVYKLFPVQNGLLVFAANGIWFITGSQGIGFAANDYTITKISEIRCISGSPFVNVLGWPLFWNEEGIYQVQPSNQAGGRADMIQVNNLCWGTILTFYNGLPRESKKYVKGDYDPINFVVTWTYRSEMESGIGNRYQYDRMLNYNTANKAFYPYTRSTNGNIQLNGVVYIAPPGGTDAPEPCLKYPTTFIANSQAYLTFSEERDFSTYTDFLSYIKFAINGSAVIGYDYTSYFITGYKLRGQGITKFQPLYIQMFQNAQEPTAYKIQGIWDYANSPNSGKYSGIQRVSNATNRFGVIYRRHKIRGRGLALQIKVISETGLPFSIIGWSAMETINQGM